MEQKRIIVSEKRFALTVDRLCHQLIEKYDRFERTCLIGIQPRGVHLSQRLSKRLQAILGDVQILSGILDITFYRDDFRTRTKPLTANTTRMDFLVENLNVILVDDVLYTGRTVQAALTALNHYGRPNKVELLSLVDRQFNRHLPIQADYVGLQVDAVDQAYVKVEWAEQDGEDRILLFANKALSLEN
ncbi:MAG: bifunctional pyr operon transcriptional regulator/uracil phosphoribosyltransferase PyrR [Bacteroidota bacterium]